jgi:DNA polymerase-4
VSFNKTFAELGSDIKKPDATTVISRDNFKSVVHPLPVGELLFIGKKTAQAFLKLNIKTIGDLAAADEYFLSGHFGVNAKKMIQMARGEECEPVRAYETGREVKSVGNGTTLPRDLKTVGDIEQVVYLLAEEVAYRLRRKGFKGTTVSLSIRGADLSWVSAQETIPTPTNSVQGIQIPALSVFKKLWSGGSTLFPAVRSLRVCVSNLSPTNSARQVSFFEDTEDKNDKLSSTFDKIRRKYGTASVMFATGINGDFRIDYEVCDT